MKKVKKYVLIILMISFMGCTSVMAISNKNISHESSQIVPEIISNKKVNLEAKLFDNKGNTSDNEESFCVDSSAIWQYIGYFLLIIKIVIPILIVILGMVDFGKAVTSNDDKALPKAAISLGKRLVMGIAIFFIPTIISYIFSLIASASPQIIAITPCQKCLFNPTSSECTDYIEEAEKNRKNRKPKFIGNNLRENNKTEDGIVMPKDGLIAYNDYLQIQLNKNQEKTSRDKL